MRHKSDSVRIVRSSLTSVFNFVWLTANNNKLTSLCVYPPSRAFLYTYSLLNRSDIVVWMPITEDDLQEFIEIWNEEFHETIALGDAKHSAASLLELYAWLVFGEEDS